MQHFHATHSDIHYDIHKDLWQYLMTNYDKPKGFSWFYSLIQNKNHFGKTSNMTNWEKELGSAYSPKDWQDAMHSCYWYSHYINHWDLMLKILHRSYLTPVRLSLIFRLEPNSCWRQCGAKSSITHILWECKNIRSFWYVVFNHLPPGL